MARLVFVVEMSSNEQTELDYLEQLRKTFVAITELRAWGYTDDEVFSRSNLGYSSTRGGDVILGKKFFKAE